MNEVIMAAIEPYIWEAIGGVVTVATAVVVGAATKFFNLKSNEVRSKIIHSAAVTGINAGMSKNRTDEQIVAAALAYVQTLGAADSVKALGVKPEALEHIVKSKLNALRGGTKN